jgi:hypothetical protein
MAQDVATSAPSASRAKPALPRVIPAIPISLGGKRTSKKTVAAPARNVEELATQPVAVEAIADVPHSEANGFEPKDVHVKQIMQAEDFTNIIGSDQREEQLVDVSDNVVDTKIKQEEIVTEEARASHDFELADSLPGAQEPAIDLAATGDQKQSESKKGTLPAEHVIMSVATRSVLETTSSPVVFGGTAELEEDEAEPAQQPQLPRPDESEASPLLADQVLVSQKIRQPAHDPPSTETRHVPVGPPPGLYNGVPTSQAYRPQSAVSASRPLVSAGVNSFVPGVPNGNFQEPPFPTPPRSGYNPQAPSYVRQPHFSVQNQIAIHPEVLEQQARSNQARIDQEISRSSLYMNGDGTPIENTHPGALDRSAGIIEFVHAQFGNADFADYLLRFPLPPFELPVHGLIIARSPRLRSLMAMPQYYPGNQSYPRILDIRISDKFLHHDVAFIKAIMRLYGEALPERSSVVAMASAMAPHAIQHEAMRFALSFTAAGHFLQLEEIVMYGLSLSASLLSWETVVPVLSFALEGGLSPAFNQGAVSAATSDSSSRDGNVTPSKQLDSPALAPTYGIYSDRALHNVIGFLLYNFPLGFKLDGTAAQLQEIARLPVFAEAPPMHDRKSSRLSQIRFGEMMQEGDAAVPEFITTTLSSILLTLPFQLLAHIFGSNILGERIGWESTAALMHTLTAERERRRLRALQNRRAGPPGLPMMAEDRLWNNTRWIEAVEPTEQHPARIKLVRRVSHETLAGLTPLDSGSIAST